MRTSVATIGVALLLTACAGPQSQQQTLPPNSAPAVARANPSSPIQHVIIMVQGHRGFNNLFAGFPGAASTKQGITHTGKIVPLESMMMAMHPSTVPGLDAFRTAYDNGKMDGFDLVYSKQPLFPYHFVRESQISAYWKLAKEFVLADHMFSTSISNSGWVAQLYLLAARSEVKHDEYIADHPLQAPPWGCDAPPGTTTPVYTPHGIKNGPFPCFAWSSLPELLDSAHLTWKYYLPTGEMAMNGIDALEYVRKGNDWHNVVSPQTQILSDIESGTLPQVSWVYPADVDSDNPGTGSGSKWVGTVVGALRNSQYWQHSAVIVTWETSDFFYDFVAPPRLDPVELGFRVPLLAISPYARHGYVSHTQYEFGSILKFIEEQFGLPSLGATDARANSLSDAFTFPRR